MQCVIYYKQGRCSFLKERTKEPLFIKYRRADKRSVIRRRNLMQHVIYYKQAAACNAALLFSSWPPPDSSTRGLTRPSTHCGAQDTAVTDSLHPAACFLGCIGSHRMISTDNYGLLTQPRKTSGVNGEWVRLNVPFRPRAAITGCRRHCFRGSARPRQRQLGWPP